MICRQKCLGRFFSKSILNFCLYLLLFTSVISNSNFEGVSIYHHRSVKNGKAVWDMKTWKFNRLTSKINFSSKRHLPSKRHRKNILQARDTERHFTSREDKITPFKQETWKTNMRETWTGKQCCEKEKRKVKEPNPSVLKHIAFLLTRASSRIRKTWRSIWCQ